MSNPMWEDVADPSATHEPVIPGGAASGRRKWPFNRNSPTGGAPLVDALVSVGVLMDQDELSQTQALFDELESEGYRFHWVADYERGLESLRRNEHDVCLLGDGLDRSGLELLRQVRDEGCKTPIILQAGPATGSSEDDALASGAADYVVRGATDAHALWRALRQACGHGRAMKTMGDQRDLLRAVFDSSFDLMFLTDDGERFVDANAAALAWFGITRSQLLTRHLHQFPLVSAAEAAAGWASLVSDGRYAGEWAFLRPSGESCVVEVRARASVMPGRHLWTLRDVTRSRDDDSISRDIAELKTLRNRLAIADRMTSIGTLAAGVAHEINTPLAAVLANLELARGALTCSDAPLDTEGRLLLLEELSDACDAAGRVREIVRGLRSFSSSGDEERKQPVDVRRSLESTLRLVRNDIQHRARLVEIYGDTPTVDANDGRLSQVFLNLLVNAVQALDENDRAENEITIETSCDGARVFIDVSDTGGGIDPDKLAHIFEPFYTTKPIGVGTGLGLSICHGIIRGLGGDISVHTKKVGRGTTFRVALRVGLLQGRHASVAPAPLGPIEPTPRAVDGLVGVSRKRVLVVDDEPLMVRVAARTLSPAYDVKGVTEARDALRLIEGGEKFDAILCDLMMPGMTGMEMFDELQRRVPAMSRRVIFITGGAFTPHAVAFLARVRNHKLEKPFDPATLLRLVDNLTST